MIKPSDMNSILSDNFVGGNDEIIRKAIKNVGADIKDGYIYPRSEGYVKNFAPRRVHNPKGNGYIWYAGYSFKYNIFKEVFNKTVNSSIIKYSDEDLKETVYNVMKYMVREQHGVETY